MTEKPVNWRPHDPDAIARWMKRLPTVHDLDTVAEIDRKYQKMQSHDRPY